jgi:hypothetical protein
VWFKDGVTADGRAAIKAMEAAGVILHLVKPSPRLLAEVLDAASMPVIVSGLADVDAATATKMNAKNAVLMVEFDAADAAGSTARLQAARKAFGDADNLMLVTRAENADKGRQDFYLSLVKNGWTKDEIYATAGLGPNGRAGGPVLTKLGFTAPAGRF